MKLLTLPDLLSLSRIPLGAAMAVSIHGSQWMVATTLLWVAIATDVADGYLARRKAQTTPLGGVLDHASDATFVTLALAALTTHGWVPVALPALIPFAFLQYLLDSKSLRGKPLRASQLGRYNGICYFVLVGFPVMQLSLDLVVLPFQLLHYIGWGLVLTTTLSMVDRLITLLSYPPGDKEFTVGPGQKDDANGGIEQNEKGVHDK